jgi:hypothetical protein
MRLKVMNDMRKAMLDGGNASILLGRWIGVHCGNSPISLR